MIQSRIYAKEHHYRSFWILAPGRPKRDPLQNILFAFPPTRGWRIRAGVFEGLGGFGQVFLRALEDSRRLVGAGRIRVRIYNNYDLLFWRIRVTARSNNQVTAPSGVLQVVDLGLRSVGC